METEPCAKPNSIGLCVSVLLVFKETLWCNVSQLDVSRMRTAAQEKSVILPLKIATHCAVLELVQWGPPVELKTTGKHVLAILPCKEMAIPSVKNVRNIG